MTSLSFYHLAYQNQPTDHWALLRDVPNSVLRVLLMPSWWKKYVMSWTQFNADMSHGRCFDHGPDPDSLTYNEGCDLHCLEQAFCTSII